MAKIAGQWASATQLNPSDKGQIAIIATGLIRNTNMRTEDAWLSALVNWTYNHPDPESKFVLSSGILRFLDIYGHSAGLSPECRSASREVAERLTHEYALFDPAILKSIDKLAQQQRLKKRLREHEEQKLNIERHIKLRERNYIKPSPPKPIEGPVNKGNAYKHAINFLSQQLSAEGHEIRWSSNNRGDIPSLITEKGGIKFYILLHLDITPASTSPAPFIISRFCDEAANTGAYLRLAKVTIYNREAQSESEKKNITGENIGFDLLSFEPINRT